MPSETALSARLFEAQSLCMEWGTMRRASALPYIDECLLRILRPRLHEDQYYKTRFWIYAYRMQRDMLSRFQKLHITYVSGEASPFKWPER